MLSIVLLLFALTSNAQPIIDYNDVVNLLPTEPQTTNDTLAAIVRDPVVQDAVEDSIGNGPLEGLVVKKKVFIMPATEPTKVRTIYFLSAVDQSRSIIPDIFLSRGTTLKDWVAKYQASVTFANHRTN